MKRAFYLSVCMMLVLALCVSAWAASSVPDSVLKATESVVRVLAEYADGYATGSGFVIKSDAEETLIATNYHVVEDNPSTISVWLNEEETVSASIYASTDQKDICILKLAYPVSMQALSLAQTDANQGDAVYAVGFPAAADYLSDTEAHASADATITDGIISALREASSTSYASPTKILQINAAINSGNSGGPLLNAEGVVVGINTYGIDDAQGIFGAIAVSELESFMADHGILISVQESSFPWIGLVVAIFVLLAAAVLIPLFVRKKKLCATNNKAVETVKPLRAYMESYPNGMGIQDATALLMPVALQLRDLHNNGSAHLQVSPNAITVGANGANLRDATSSEADRYITGYAAPEIYKGNSAGCLSDIYSFCAVLSYVTSGKDPANALSRLENDENAQEPAPVFTPWEDLIQTGMELDPQKRPQSMQDIIYKLSAYHVQPFAAPMEAIEESQKSVQVTKTRKFPALKVAIISLLLLAGACSGFYVGSYQKAKSEAQNGNFSKAEKLLLLPAVTEKHDPQLVAYIEAGKELENRDYDEANAAFLSLSGYMNSADLANEAIYRQALQYADANDFDQAEELMTELSEIPYKDSEDRVLEMQYRKGAYLLENGSYSEAVRIFNSLSRADYEGAEEMANQTQYIWALELVDQEKYIEAYNKFQLISGYSDTDECLEALKELIYLEAQEDYRSGDYEIAQNKFETISPITTPYEDSEKYITLITARTSTWAFLLIYGLDDLIDMFGFEDSADVLVSNSEIACNFLEGIWTTSDDSYYFMMEITGDDDFHCSYNLPGYGGSFQIEDGIYSVTSDSYDDKPQFKFTVFDPDGIYVYCYKNGVTYTLYR